MTIEGRVLSPAQAAFVADARVARLATIGLDGVPHVVPVCAVLDLDRVVLASAYDRKIAYIRENPAVGLCVDEYSEDWAHGLRQVVLYGEAYLLEGGFEFERDRTLLYEKFPQYPDVAPIEEGGSVIVEIRVDRAASTGLD